jgi:hypothetical protein
VTSLTRASARAALFYVALTLLVTFPLVLRLTSVVPHDLGDPLMSASILWWNAHVLPLTERWWNGFAFFPATGMLAFSDHRLGMSLIASPLQWLGAGPVTAYNLAFLATFPLCAIAAHGLVFTLTKRHDAALIGGLAYGFNPFRVAHFSHLELLAAFGMPAALAALHLFVRERRVKWIAVFAAALCIQALCASYYTLFFSVFLALWMLWFLRLRDWRVGGAIAIGCACAAAVISPVAIGYWRIHQHYGFHRGLFEVKLFSADVTSLVTASPLLPLWGWTFRFNPGPERQIFPGLTIAVLAAIGLGPAIWRYRVGPDRWRWVSLALFFVACVFSAVALSVAYIGPWDVTIAGVRISATVTYKPITVAFFALLGCLAARPWARAAWHERSALAFYLVAAAFLFLCTLGPEPTFLGQTILYKPPYSWLMNLPLFADEVRAPARFAMPAALALAVAGALAFNRFTLNKRRRRLILAVAMIGIVADGWIGRYDLPTIPATWPIPAGQRFGPVLELPFEEGASDFLAMYRTTLHGHPTVNGQSGYFPPHYSAMRLAFEEGDASAFDAFTQTEPLLIVLNTAADPEGRWNTLVRKIARAKVVATDSGWTIFSIPPPETEAVCPETELGVMSAVDDHGPIDVSVLTDHNPLTSWITKEPQHAGDTLTLDMGRTSRLCAVRMSLYTSWHVYPRLLSIATSVDGSTWTPAFSESTAGLAIRGAIAQPRDVWLNVPVQSEAARFIRLRLEKSHKSAPWFIPELRLIGSAR